MKTTITKSRSGHYTVTIRTKYEGTSRGRPFFDEFVMYRRGKLSSLLNAQRVADAVKRNIVMPTPVELADGYCRRDLFLAADRIAKEVM
jgi:hypothetical protein